MKKIFLAVMAIAALAACSKDEQIAAPKGEAIAFGDAFVDNATRADYTSGKTVEKFQVWGTVQGTHANPAAPVYIFDGDEVNSTGIVNDEETTVNYGQAWFCENVQYWVPNAKYAFTAIVDGKFTKTNNVYDHATIPFTVDDGDRNKDLLLATATASVANDGTVSAGESSDSEISDGLVKFKFSHLLSKLQFNAPEHNYGNGYSVVVTDIEVTGVLNNGVYTIANGGSWAKAQGAQTNVTLNFPAGDGGDFETRQILPIAQVLTVTITYNVEFGDTVISKDVTKSGQISNGTDSNGDPIGYTFNKGYVYAITPNITANQINFTVATVDGWTPGSGINVQ